MKTFPLAFLLLLSTELLTAQPCTPENVSTLPGKWQSPQFPQHDVDPAAVTKIGPILRAVNQALKDGYRWSVQGGQITTHDHVSSSDYSAEPFYLRKKVIPARVYWYFQDYLCLHGKVDVNEASTEFEVRYNQFPFIFNESFFRAPINDPTAEDMHTNTYTYSPVLPRFENGIWDVYEGLRGGTSVLAYDTTELEQVDRIIRVVAKPGVAPIVPMTKQEYYDNNIQVLRHTIAENQKIIDDTRASKDLDEATKKQMYEMYEGQKKIAADIIAVINATKSAHSKEALSKPAISHEEDGRYIDSPPDFSQGEQYVIKPNPAYFNFKLATTDLQLCSIVFSIKGQTRGKEVTDLRFIADQQFTNHLFEMDAIGIATKKMQPLIKN